MGIEKSAVVTYRVKMKCEYCPDGYMESTGQTLMSNPPQYPHVCSVCRSVKTFLQIYPNIEYEEVIEREVLD